MMEQKMFEPKTYKKSPTKEEVEEDYAAYIKVYGEKERKAGKTMQPDRRYLRKGGFSLLTKENHIAYAVTSKFARDYEILLMEVLDARDMSDGRRDTREGGSTSSSADALQTIYLVESKPDSDKCPACEEPPVWIEYQQEREDHWNSKHIARLYELKESREILVSAGNQAIVDLIDEELNWIDAGVQSADDASVAGPSTKKQKRIRTRAIKH